MSNQNLDSGFAGSSTPVGAGGPTTSSVAPPTFLGGVDGSNSPLPSLQKLIDALSYDYEYPERNDSCRREEALDLLSKNREICADLGPLLWNSVGTMFTLLEEVMSAYSVLSSPDRITRLPNLITRVCNALVLLRCVASHPKTRKQFTDANIPLYLYPFLGTVSGEKHIEIWRLTSLGVIGALAKENDAEVTHFLLKSEVFPYCLRCMEFGHDLSKAVATYIIQRILMHEEGLKYCCSTAERFFAVGRVLGNMIKTLAEEPPRRLLRQIILCYVRLSESSRACDGLRHCLPPQLIDGTYVAMLCEEDPTYVGLLQTLHYNVTTGHRPKQQQLGDLFQHLTLG